MKDPVSVAQAAEWLKQQRAELGASTTLVARMATLIANRQGDRVRIFQQQISDIENARPGKGPKTLRPWFRYVRQAFDSGVIAEALGRPDPERRESRERTYYIQDEKGDTVGKIIWFGEPA